MARYGGEEFVILLPNASLDNAVKKADKICKTIAQTRYALDDIEPGKFCRYPGYQPAAKRVAIVLTG